MKYWFQNILDWFESMVAYSPLLWRDRDWDYAFLLEMIKFKLGRMRKNLGQGFAADRKKTVEQIKEAENLLKLMIADDFCKKEHAAHDKKWGRNQMTPNEGMVRTKVKTPKDKEQERKEFLAIMDLEFKRSNKAWDDFFNHMRRHTMKWWD